MKPKSNEFTDNPWEGIEMPEGFDPQKNEFLRSEAPEEPPEPESPEEGTPEYAVVIDHHLHIPVVDNPNLEKTLKEWQEFHQSKGQEMLSMRRLYRIATDLTKAIEDCKAYGNQVQQELVYAVRGELQQAFSEREVILNTEISYLPGLEAEIIHPGTTAPKRKVEIRPYRGEKLKDVMVGIPGNTGFEFIQALFDTKDDSETMLKNLGIAFNTFADSYFMINTPQDDKRGKKRWWGKVEPARYTCSIKFRPGSGGFDVVYINCDHQIDRPGKSSTTKEYHIA